MSQKTKVILLSILVVLSLTIGVFIDALIISPRNVTVRYMTVTSDKIDANLDDLTILFFSDLHYNGFTDEARLSKIVSKINEQKADIVVFLGDLYEQNNHVIPSSSAQTTLVSYLKQIEAPFGKFAIYGDQDLANGVIKDIVDTNFAESDFEVLADQKHPISLKGYKTIDLYALNPELNGIIDYNKTFENFDKRNYSIVLCHTPDTVLNIYQYQPDRMIAGHTLGGQIYVPVLGSVHRYDYGVRYYRSTQKIDNTILDVNSGVGTTWKDIRFFSKAEIEVYHFYSESE